jgi:PKHD-type hydroxylase
MKGEWCYFKNYFTPEVCNSILEEGLKLPEKDAEIGSEGGVRTENEYRRSKIRFIHQNDSKFTWLFDSLWKMALQANDEWFGVHISKITYIQLAEYDESYLGEYKRHHDVFWMNGDPDYHRKLTCVIQLSHPSTYEGGNLELYNITEYPKAEEIRAQGTAIFFPSVLEHAATQVTKGKRYSLACWFDGPKWR